jgi:ferritin-like metal-binding protein YciE
MSRSEQKIVQYLGEAHAMELGLVRDLQAQIAMAPRGSYRSALQTHLQETREHARSVQVRLEEVRGGGNPIQAMVGLAESTVSQLLALGKAPLSLLRGASNEEKVLKNAKEACASEALEIATYTAIEHLARSIGDETTADLAVSIGEDEQRMLARVMRELPRLTGAVVGVEIEGQPSFDLGDTGAADAARELAQTGKQAARKAEVRVRRTARSARRIPGVAQAEGQIKGMVASEQDLAVADYDKLNASDLVEKLPGLSQVDLAKVDSYERKNQNRTTVLARISSLRGSEPWPGYDDQGVEEIRKALADADETRAKEIQVYERAHKNRTGVLAAAEREAANA